MMVLPVPLLSKLCANYQVAQEQCTAYMYAIIWILLASPLSMAKSVFLILLLSLNIGMQ